MRGNACPAYFIFSRHLPSPSWMIRSPFASLWKQHQKKKSPKIKLVYYLVHLAVLASMAIDLTISLATDRLFT